jgi:glucokinase
MEYAGSVDVGGTHTKIGLVDRDGRILAQARLAPDPRGAFEALAGTIVEGLERLHGEAGGHLSAIGIGNPGYTDCRTGITVGGAFNVPCLHGNSLSASLGSRFGVPARADNDGTCAAAGELAWGAGRGRPNFLLIALGTGIGGGLALEGRVVRGARGFAGEVGHFCVQPGGLECMCGARGCLEQYASAGAILRLYQGLRRERGLPTDPSLGPGGVLAAASSGDPLALQVVNEAARAIAQVFGSVTNLLNLEACIIGGGLSQAGDFLLRRVREAARGFTLPLFAEGLQVLPAELCNDAGLLGAAALAWEAASPQAGVPAAKRGRKFSGI